MWVRDSRFHSTNKGGVSPLYSLYKLIVSSGYSKQKTVTTLTLKRFSKLDL